MITYINGNTKVSIDTDGTKTREYYSKPKLEFPESIDLKITNYCDLSNYCKWCHENSNKDGQHSDLETTLHVLRSLPPGVELAIGGGNPLDHPDLIEMLTVLRDQGVISNMTINQLHVKKFLPLIKKLINEKLINGVGISYSGMHMEQTKELLELTDNIVFHMIVGINTLDQLEEVSKIHNKVLLLGYKQYRKGKGYYSDKVRDNIEQWYMYLPKFFKKLTLAFDNLGIKQLNLKRFFTDMSWDSFYMGDDGSHTFYVDMVEEKFSKNSTGVIKYDILDNVTDMFQLINNNYKEGN